MADFIYDDRGACVARIIESDVFSETTRDRIATIREGNIYALNGQLVGHLRNAGLVRNAGDAMPEPFARLLSSIKDTV